METKLYQESDPEQSGGGLDLAPSVEQRVSMVRERIRSYMQAHGGLKLRLGTYCTGDPQGDCTACALGTLALSFGFDFGPIADHVRNSARVARRLMDSSYAPLVSRQEADLIEMGFEGSWYPWHEADGVKISNLSSPFYHLGRELRSVALASVG